MNGLVIFWIAVAVILGIIESLTLSLTCIWGAVAAIFCAVISSFGIPVHFSVYAFILITALLLMATRPVVRKFLTKENTPTNADRIIGAEGVVVKKITVDNAGEVKVMGQYWSAISSGNSEISEGTRVLVRSIDGVKVKVEIV